MQIESFTKRHSIKSGLNVSDRIRSRLIEAGERFHANDNIASYIHDDELEQLCLEVEHRLEEVLRALVIDTENDHNSVNTAKRVAKMFVKEVFRGRYETNPETTAFPNVMRLDELIVVGPITVRSACSHHLCPIIGKLWIGVMPDASSELIGLSKYARIADWIMNRPQIQEEAVVMLADMLEEVLRPNGLAVLMKADHMCLQWRGVKDCGTSLHNSVMRGCFQSDTALRMDFHQAISS